MASPTSRCAILLLSLLSLLFADTAALRSWIDQTRGFDGALLHPSVRVAVNNEIVDDPSPVSDADEIAFMPPVGGG